MTKTTEKRGSKRSKAIEIINANPTKNQTEVANMIADAINVTRAVATSYYRYCVKNGLTTVKELVADPNARRGRKAGSKTKIKKTPEERKAVTKVDTATAMAALERARARAAKAKAARLAPPPSTEDVEEL